MSNVYSNYKQEKWACLMYKIKYDYAAFAEDKTVKTRIDPDDPLMERFNDPRKPIEQYEAGEEYIYFNCSNFDTDFIAEEDEDIYHPLYSRGAYEYCILGMGRTFSHLHFPRRNFVITNLWEKMYAEVKEHEAALEAGVDFDHLPGMPWIGTIEK